MEIIDSSLIAMFKAPAMPAPERSLGARRRKSGTLEVAPRAARRLSLALAPTNAPEPGRNALAGAKVEAHSSAAANAATQPRIAVFRQVKTGDPDS